MLLLSYQGRGQSSSHIPLSPHQTPNQQTLAKNCKNSVELLLAILPSIGCTALSTGSYLPLLCLISERFDINSQTYIHKFSINLDIYMVTVCDIVLSQCSTVSYVQTSKLTYRVYIKYELYQHRYTYIFMQTSMYRYMQI